MSNNIVKLIMAGAALPELVVTSSNPAATAKGLAGLIAQHDTFLSNGNAVVMVVVDDDTGMPKAIEASHEAIRVFAHEISKPVKVKKITGGVEHIPIGLSRDIALLYLNGLEGQWGLKPRHHHVADPQARRHDAREAGL
jgi:hypothetical protein